MLGHVHMLAIRGSFRNDKHPHVVALDLNPNECIVVPSFTVGGAEVEKYILDARGLFGLTDDAIFVQLDNANCVKLPNRPLGATGNQSYWLTARARRINKVDLPSGKPFGEMCPECLVDVLSGLKAFCENCPKVFTAKTVHVLGQTIQSVRERISSA